MEELMLTEDSTPEMRDALSQLDEQEKNYYCQRCLNHNEFNPRKGHKPDCRYLKCPCAECTMVEQRRQLNNLLSKKKVHITPTTQTRNGKRVRDPHCARCSAHGVLVPLRGHKRSMCQFVTCTCTLCALVENRRMLMAAQIKLRRLQQKTRDGKETKKERKGAKKREELLKEHIVNTQVVPQQDEGSEKGTDSTSPTPSSPSTMSPSLSMSPPSSPSPPSVVAPVPIYPLNIHQLSSLLTQNALQTQNALLLMNCLQAPPTLPVGLQGSLLTEQFSAALASMYLKGCLKI